MKVSYELEQGYIDVWNEETEEWDRYIKVNKKSVVGVKNKIPEKLEEYISCGWYGTCKDLPKEELFKSFKKIGDKINEIIDYLREKEDE